jgi:hypothetical protein
MKENRLLLFAIICLALAIALNGILQNVAIIGSLFYFSFYLSLVFKVNKKFTGFVTVIIIAYVSLMYLQFKNAIDLGFPDGLLEGWVNEKLYHDTNMYYYESLDLANIFHTDLALWLSGYYPTYGFYGPYNIYNIYTAMLMNLYGQDINTLILLKMFWTVASLYILYSLSRDYFKITKPELVVVLFSICPAYILMSITLMRDNVFVLLIMGIVYYYYNAFVGSRITWLKMTILIACCGILILFRGFAVVIPIALLIHYLLSQKLSLKTIIALFFMVFIGAFGFLLLLNKYEAAAKLAFAGLEYDNSGAWFSDRTQGIRIFIYSMYYYFLGYTADFSAMISPVVSETYNNLSAIYLNIINITATISLIYFFVSPIKAFDRKFLLVVGFIVPYVFLCFYTFGFGAVIPRIYLMWSWIQCIIIILAQQHLSRRQINLGVTYGAIILLTVYILKVI